LAIYCYSATCFPQEWLYAVIALIVIPPVLVYFLLRRKSSGSGSGESPVEQRNVWLQTLDEAGVLQLGEILTGADRTEDTLMFWHPDWVDEEGNPYHAEVPIDREIPGRALDSEKNVIELWIVAKRGDDLTIISFSGIANKLPPRFDPLPANPRKVGRFYVGWPFGKTGGLSSLIESTTGKLLAFGGLGLICFFVGLLVAAGAHLHFA
jgi:hypothetical protein